MQGISRSVRIGRRVFFLNAYQYFLSVAGFHLPSKPAVSESGHGHTFYIPFASLMNLPCQM